MRRIWGYITLVFVVAAAVLVWNDAAWADHEYGGGGWREGCGEQGGGCGNEREETYYGDGSCKYVCPQFDRSPVENSFNPTICVMPGSCSGEQQQDGGGGGAGSGEAHPMSLFPPDPTKIGEYIGAGFKLGTDFAAALTTLILEFVGSIGTFVV